MKSLLDIEIKDSDYENIGKFVYKYIDTLLNDKLPEGEEKNIARFLLDYQKYEEYLFAEKVEEFYNIINSYCSDITMQNRFIIDLIKQKATEMYQYNKEEFSNITSSVSRDREEALWKDSVKITRSKLSGEIPDIMRVSNLINIDCYLKLLLLLKENSVVSIDISI